MKIIYAVTALSAALMVSAASAQGVNLSGRWDCIAMCLAPPGNPAFITQNGWQLNALNEAGMPSRGWIDYPGHLWLEQAHVGALISPDGDTLQFDNGTIWQRAPELPPPPPPLPPRYRKS